MQNAREVVARSNGQDGHGRGGTGSVLTYIVQAGESPAYRPVAAAHEDLEPRKMPETVQSGQWTTIIQIKHLMEKKPDSKQEILTTTSS